MKQENTTQEDTTQAEALTIDSLFGEDKDKQAEVAFYVACNPNGYDTAFFMTPQGKEREVRAAVLKGRQIDLINRNRGHVATLTEELHRLITTTTADTVGLEALRVMKEQGTDASGFLALIRGEFGLPDLAKVAKADASGQVQFATDGALAVVIAQTADAYLRTVAALKAVVRVVREVAAWEHFGRFVDEEMLTNCSTIEEGLSELYAVTLRQMNALAACLSEYKPKAVCLRKPDKIPAKRETLNTWHGIIKSVKL